MGRQARRIPLLLLAWALAPGSATCRGDGDSRPDDRARAATDAVIAGGVGSATARSSIGATVLRGQIEPSLLKGSFGEQHMNRYLARYFARKEGWSTLQARVGSQGIDGLRLRYDPTGRPSGLIVAEAKYGSSRLGQTADGVQMGPKWRATRLDAMGRNYRSIADAIETNTMKVAGPGGSVGKQRLQVDLPGTRKAAVFTRAAAGKPWEFVGPRRLLAEAGPQAERIGTYLQRAARGEVPYRSEICRVELKGGALHVTVKDAGPLGAEVGEARLATRRSLKIPLSRGQFDTTATILRSQVARRLRERYPHLAASDIRDYSRQIVRDTRSVEQILNNRPPSVRAAIARNSVGAGGVAAAIDVGVQAAGQYLATGHVRWREVATASGIAFGGATLGAAAGQATTASLVRMSLTRPLIARATAILGGGSARLGSQLLGGAAGGGVASVVFAVGGYLTGTYDASTAARMGIVGVSSTALGLAASGGLFALATTIGTASTGTAIAGLHGAAATSAAMAWLGGGTVAAGGAGAAGGAVVLSGGTAIVVIGSGILLNYGFSYWDERADLRRIELTIDRLARKVEFVAAGTLARGISTTRIKTQ